MFEPFLLGILKIFNLVDFLYTQTPLFHIPNNQKNKEIPSLGTDITHVLDFSYYLSEPSTSVVEQRGEGYWILLSVV